MCSRLPYKVGCWYFVTENAPAAPICARWRFDQDGALIPQRCEVAS